MKEIIIGYWRITEDQTELSHPYAKKLLEFPFPIENSLKKENAFLQEKVLTLLKKELENSRKVFYRGYSNCRICNKLNGSAEFDIVVENTKFIIPEGYLHYIEDHNVEIDFRLLKLFKSKLIQILSDEDIEKYKEHF